MPHPRNAYMREYKKSRKAYYAAYMKMKRRYFAKEYRAGRIAYDDIPKSYRYFVRKKI